LLLDVRTTLWVTGSWVWLGRPRRGSLLIVDGSNEQRTSSLPRYTRRLSDKILIAFHQGCDQNDVEVAQCLLAILDFMVQRPPTDMEGGERRTKANLAAAHERLWQMRHPEAVGY
jgi:hypothetical protein